MSSTGSILLVVIGLLALFAFLGFMLYKKQQGPASDSFLGRVGGNSHENPMYENPLASGNAASALGNGGDDQLYAVPAGDSLVDTAC